MTSNNDNNNIAWSTHSSNFIRNTVGPTLLLIICPLIVNIFSYICISDKFEYGNLYSFLKYSYMLTQSDNSKTEIYNFVTSEIFQLPTSSAIYFISMFIVIQLFLYICIPGKKFKGPRTENGHIPVYYDNGLLCFILTNAIYYILIFHFKVFSSTIIYDELIPLLTLLNVTSLILCVILYFKGLLYPSTKDSGTCGNFAIDMYWGTELYPRVYNVDIKQFIICRLGIVLWYFFAISFYFASIKDLEQHHHDVMTMTNNNGQFVSTILMSIYIVKFFCWEKWYLHAADIQVDRFGFMLCWGTLVFMPCIHTLQNCFMVHTHTYMSNNIMYLYLFFGNTMTYLNYDSDTQRHIVRDSIDTFGGSNVTVWGKPVEYIIAKYKTNGGEEHTSILSCSGYNGLVRHFHYLPDIINLFLYCSPAGFNHILPFMYFIYLTILLLDRTYRIDERCLKKYGKYWMEYCEKVRYRLIPGVW